jgi:hypothetical protein
MDIPSNQSVLVMDDIEVTDGIAEWAKEIHYLQTVFRF